MKMNAQTAYSIKLCKGTKSQVSCWRKTEQVAKHVAKATRSLQSN